MSVLNKNIPCALSPDSIIFWLGFTDVGTPALLDSKGMLYFFPLGSNIWLPFCDTTKNVKFLLFLVVPYHLIFVDFRGRVLAMDFS